MPSGITRARSASPGVNSRERPRTDAEETTTASARSNTVRFSATPMASSAGSSASGSPASRAIAGSRASARLP